MYNSAMNAAMVEKVPDTGAIEDMTVFTPMMALTALADVIGLPLQT